MPHLIASGLAALVGAVVGGWITSKVVTENTRSQLVADAYNAYLPKADRALQLAYENKLTEEDRDHLSRARIILEIRASEEVLCLAYALERDIDVDCSEARNHYDFLMTTIRGEVLGNRDEGRVEDWRASFRVRCLFRRFRSGPQSGSHDRVSSPRSSNRACDFLAHGFRTRSCLRARKAHSRPRKAHEAVFVV